MQDPWYDKDSQYTVPYVTWTTGIGYRTDKVATTPDELSNPYEIYWDEANKGKLYLLDDSRDAPAHMLLKNGITDINTENPDEIDAREGRAQVADRRRQRQALDRRLHEPPRGQGLGAPDVVGQRDLGAVVPARREPARRRSASGSRRTARASIGNDMIAIPRNAKNPVLAHHFLNYLLDEKHGYDNFANYVGYQPPFTKLDPDRLVADGVVPANLKTAIVRESDFDTGYSADRAHAGRPDALAERLGRVQGGCLSPTAA